MKKLKLKKCPKCQSEVEMYGSECYPESGIMIECSNLDCDYHMNLQNTIRSNSLREALSKAHNYLVDNHDKNIK